jgi:predicted transcriptional regulator
MLKSAEIKIRVEPTIKLGVEQIAQEEHLDVADIVRRALREYIQRRSIGHASKGI